MWDHPSGQNGNAGQYQYHNMNIFKGNGLDQFLYIDLPLFGSGLLSHEDIF